MCTPYTTSASFNLEIKKEKKNNRNSGLLSFARPKMFLLHNASNTRQFLRMTKMPLPPIRKLPNVSSIGQVSRGCFMALGGIWKPFQVFFLVRICLLGCLLRYLVKRLVLNGAIFE